MRVESLEVLENASVAPAQARAIVRAIEIELAAAKDTLATKHDIVTLGAQLRVEIEAVRSDLRSEIHRSMSGVTRQMYMAILGQLAVLLGFAYFSATHVA
jgi:hypothetical protein